MALLVSWLILTIAVWLTALLLPGFHVRNFRTAVWVAALLGVLNVLLGWLLFAFFTVATLGLAWVLAFVTRWIIDAILLKMVDGLMDGLKIDGFGWALAGAFVMSAIGTVGEWLLRG